MLQSIEYIHCIAVKAQGLDLMKFKFAYIIHKQRKCGNGTIFYIFI